MPNAQWPHVRLNRPVQAHPALFCKLGKNPRILKKMRSSLENRIEKPLGKTGAQPRPISRPRRLGGGAAFGAENQRRNCTDPLMLIETERKPVMLSSTSIEAPPSVRAMAAGAP